MERIWRKPDHFVYRHGDRVIKIITHDLEPNNARRSFWMHKIASELFPKNVLKYRFARDLQDNEKGKTPAKYRSVYVNDPILAHVIQYRGDFDHHNACNTCKKHFKFYHGNAVQDTMQKMQDAGIYIDPQEYNVANRHADGKPTNQPLFFEVTDIDKKDCIKAIANLSKKKREKIRKMLVKLTALGPEE